MKLVIEDEAGTRSVVPFGNEPIVVGRAAEDVAFRLAERNVSRRHARFVRQNGGVFVEDLGSLTGTRVNGERITGRRRLRPGDLVQIGDYDLAVLGEEETAVPGAPPPLPGGAREPAAGAARVEAQPAPPAAAPPPSPRASALRRTLVAGAVALAAGAAAGWAVGALTGR
jgi:predicted component of type VI protein secretion system